MNLQIIPIDELLSGFMDNMSDEQIDSELKLFQDIAVTLGLKRKCYDTMATIIDHEDIVDDQMLFDMSLRLCYKPYQEKNQASGSTFLYFRNMADAERMAEYIESNLENEE